MKKSIIIVAAMAGLALIAGAIYFLMPNGGKLPGLGSKPKDDGMVAVVNRPITQAIEAVAGATDVSLGKVDTDGASISIPRDSFSSSTKISLLTPEKIPAFDPNIGELLGVPIEVNADGTVRLDDKATLTFKLTAGSITTSTEAYHVRIAYYNETE